jgi:hypothetical protein
MRLTMKQRQAVTAVTVQRYRNGSKKVKRQILDEFVRPLVTVVVVRVLCCVITVGKCGLRGTLQSLIDSVPRRLQHSV